MLNNKTNVETDIVILIKDLYNYLLFLLFMVIILIHLNNKYVDK